MKRNSLLLAFAMMFCVSMSFAQTNGQKIKEPAKTVFNPHWFMQIQGGAAQTIGEVSFSKLITPAAALNFGYQFSPAFAIRFGASGFQGKGGVLIPSQKEFESYKYNYLQGNIDAMLSLSNLLCKYNPKRVLDVYAFLGAGINHDWGNDDAASCVSRGAEMKYLWENQNLLAGRGGLGAKIRLSDAVDLNIEANANVMSDKFNSKKAGNADWQFNALVGLAIKLGKGSTTTPAVYYDPEPVPQPKAEPKPQPKPAPAPAPKAEPLTRNIFFAINKSIIRPSEQAKIDELVSYLKKYPNATVAITGYADKPTGNPTINSRLSIQRAAAVSKALQSAGIAESRIFTDAKGDTVQPFATQAENRVSICIATDK